MIIILFFPPLLFLYSYDDDNNNIAYNDSWWQYIILTDNRLYDGIYVYIIYTYILVDSTLDIYNNSSCSGITLLPTSVFLAKL